MPVSFMYYYRDRVYQIHTNLVSKVIVCMCLCVSILDVITKYGHTNPVFFGRHALDRGTIDHWHHHTDAPKQHNITVSTHRISGINIKCTLKCLRRFHSVFEPQQSMAFPYMAFYCVCVCTCVCVSVYVCTY